MRSFDFQPRTRVIFGAGVIDRLGELARELNFKRTLLVADRGLVASGHVEVAGGVPTMALEYAGKAPRVATCSGTTPSEALLTAGATSCAFRHCCTSPVQIGVPSPVTSS